MSGYFSRTNAVNLIQVFPNAIDAINFLSSPEGAIVNLIFLDIEMPEMSGIEFMRAINLTDKEVVIYSSQEKYALESYEYNVCDYLLKPVAYSRFIRAITKAQTSLDQKQDHSKKNNDVEDNDNDSDVIFLKDNLGNVHKIRFADIAVIQAMENYVSVHTTKQKIIVHIPMKKIMESMPENYVQRIHRSFAIGLRYISKVNRDKIKVEFGVETQELPLSRTYSTAIKKTVSALSKCEE